MTRSRVTVAQVLHSLKIGGAEVLAACIARRLQNDFSCVFICLDEEGTMAAELRAEGFPVEVLQRQAGLDFGCARQMARAVKRHAVDVIHAHQYTPFFYSVLGRGLGRRPGILFTEHGRHFPDLPSRKRQLVNRFLLRGQDRVVGVGEAVRRALIDNEGMPATRVGVVYNGISLPPGEPSAEDCRRARLAMQVDDANLVLLQVARLDPLKDHATAVRAFARVLAERPEARLVIVGDGPTLPSVRAMIDERGLTGSVRLLGMRQDVPQLLPGADVVFLSSVSEGIPVTLLEGMATWRPVVSTAVGGVAEVIEAEVSGLLVPAGDDAALAQCFLRLASDSALCRRLAVAGRRRVEDRFTQARMVGEYSDLYRQIHGGETHARANT